MIVTSTEIKGSVGNVEYHGRHDGVSWYIEYTRDGATVTDSEKITHPDVVGHVSARRADQIARAVAAEVAS